jgi:hypothetical protein
VQCAGSRFRVRMSHKRGFARHPRVNTTFSPYARRLATAGLDLACPPGADGAEVIDELATRSRDSKVLPARMLLLLVRPYDERFGPAHAIELTADGITRAGSDPRSDGAAIIEG